VQKIKIFFLCDDIRAYSGVSIQANKLLKGLLKKGKYEIIHGAIAINHNKTPFKGESHNYFGIKVYDLPSYSTKAGDWRIVDWIIQTERPDIVICFGDPRFFYYLFSRDNEIRTEAKLVLYHTWDNDPFPIYNIPSYDSCDHVVTISKLSHNLLKENGIENTYIPHGYDPSEFYKLPQKTIKEEKENFFSQLAKVYPEYSSSIDKIIFWNNRNMSRKRPLDLMRAYADYFLEHQNAILFMHTDPVSPSGSDLLSYHSSLEKGNLPIAFSSEPIDSQKLNMLYNISDISVNISSAEGFGLCVGESLLTTTPVLGTKTGGITEQLSDGNNDFGMLLSPLLRVLQGHPLTPYCYGDFVSTAQVQQGFEFLLGSMGDLETKGEAGRLHIIENYHIDNTIAKWNSLLEKVQGEDSKFKKWKLISI